MALEQYTKRTSSLVNALKNKDSDVETVKSTYDPAKQAKGLETRLEGSGIDVAKATDSRNVVERLFNLPEKQNAFFDLFEVLGRPQQALFTAINAVQNGESFGSGFTKGLTGKEFTQFSKVLNDAGMGDDESFGLDDVLGFAGDVMLDPADLAILAGSVVAAPVSGGTSLAAGGAALTALNAADNVSDVARAAKTVDKLMDTAKVLGKSATKSAASLSKKMSVGFDANKLLYKEVGKTLGKNPLKAAKMVFSSKNITLGTGQVIKKTSVTNMTMKGLFQTAKFGGKAVDMGIRTGFSMTASGGQKATKYYDDFLKATQGWFDKAAKLGDEQLNKVKGWIGSKSGGAVRAGSWREVVDGKIDKLSDTLYKSQQEVATNAGQVFNKTKEEFIEEIKTNLMEYGELKYTPETTMKELLNSAYRWELPIDDKSREALSNILNTPVFSDLKVNIIQSPRRQALQKTQGLEIKRSLNNVFDSDIAEINTRLAGIEVNTPQGIELTTQLETLKKSQETLSKANVGYKNTTSFKKHLQTLVDKGATDNIKSKASELLQDFDNQLAREGSDLVSDLYQSATMENGKTVHVLRQTVSTTGDSVVAKQIDAINARFKELSELVSDTTVTKIKELGRFAPNSDAEREIRALLEKVGGNKTLEDVYTLGASGMWEVVDSDTLKSLLKFIDPTEGVEKAMSAPRYRTDEEFAALEAKYASGFEGEAEFNDISETLETAMRWYDDKYNTSIKGITEGYMKHSATKEAKAALNIEYGYKQFKTQVQAVDDVPFLIGNTRAFAGRKYNMTVAEANAVSKFNAQRMLDLNEASITKGAGSILNDKELAFWKDKQSQKLFSEYFTDSFSDTLHKMNDYGSAINIMDTALVRATFNDSDIMRVLPEGAMNTPVSPGFIRTDSASIQKKIENMSKVYKDNEYMTKFSKEFLVGKGPKVDIDKNVFEMIGRVGLDKHEVGAFMEVVDKTNAMFKKLKIFSLGFHFKNFIGNASNLYLAGVPSHKLAPLLVDGVNTHRKGVKLLSLVSEHGDDVLKTLSTKDQETYRVYKIFIDSGMEDAGAKLYDLDNLINNTKKGMMNTGERLESAKTAFKSGKVVEGTTAGLDTVLQGNIQLNQIVDSGYRIGYIRNLMKQGLSEEEIVSKVKLALFDPSDLTGAEKEVARRLIPFYTFTKKNLAYQMKNSIENPVRYKRLMKSVKGTWDLTGIDYTNQTQDYQKENMWLPIPATLKDGKYVQLKTSFPMSDYAEFLSNPATKILSAMNPFIKTPFEMVTNKQVFSGQEISQFAGQESSKYAGISKKQEYLLQQTGADKLIQPFKSVYDVLKSGDAIQGIPTVASRGSTAQAETSASYDKLNTLTDLIKYYKQEGIDIKTIADIENINKPLATLSETLRALSKNR